MLTFECFQKVGLLYSWEGAGAGVNRAGAGGGAASKFLPRAGAA
jgi:hypothetical protein